MIPAWLLAITLYMCASVHINFCVFTVLNSNYLKREGVYTEVEDNNYNHVFQQDGSYQKN